MELTKENAVYGYERQYRRAPEPARPAAAAVAAPVKRRGMAARVALLLLAAMAVAAVCISYIYMKTQVFQAQRDVNAIQNEIKEAQRKNGELNEQLNEALNVNSILARAKALGMTYPKEDQVLYVTLGDNTASVEMKNGN